MSKLQTGGGKSFLKWWENPKNRKKVYDSDKADAEYFKKQSLKRQQDVTLQNTGKEAKAQEAANKKAETAQDRAAAAIARSTGAAAVEVAEVEEIDPNTGEVKKVKKTIKK